MYKETQVRIKYKVKVICKRCLQFSLQLSQHPQCTAGGGLGQSNAIQLLSTNSRLQTLAVLVCLGSFSIQKCAKILLSTPHTIDPQKVHGRYFIF